MIWIWFLIIYEFERIYAIMTGYKFPLILWLWQQSTFFFTKMINDCFYGIFCNLEIYWFESNTLLNTIYCFFFSSFLWARTHLEDMMGNFKKSLKIWSDWSKSTTVVENCCWKFFLNVVVDFLNKSFIQTWTNWTYFLKGPF